MEKTDSRIAFSAAPIWGIYHRPYGDPLQGKAGKYYQRCPGRSGRCYQRPGRKAGKTSGSQFQGHIFQGEDKQEGNRIMENKISDSQFRECAEKLSEGRHLTKEQWRILLEGRSKERRKELARRASDLRDRIYGKRIFIRGLIEFTNYCKNDCYYCGIRRSNRNASRYRLTREQILDCCRAGYELGFRTFVLQGGEDPYFNDERMAEIIRAIRKEFPRCAITLSIGEKEKESYALFKKAGADRYLLRHETADEDHYRKLHPPELSLSHRIRCLETLKELGYQTGAGIMVGSPGQTTQTLIEDMEFLERLQPEMVGIGPFIPHHDTPFKGEPQGGLELTLYLLSLIRLLLPRVLLPAMPNLSPENVREKYLLYDNKIHTGKEAAECLDALRESMKAIGYDVVVDRGDFLREDMK